MWCQAHSLRTMYPVYKMDEFRFVLQKFAYTPDDASISNARSAASKPRHIKNTKGYVYCVVNPSLPNVCKVGKTTRTVEERLHDLYSSGLIYPFRVVHQKYVEDCHETEKRLHTILRSRRIAKNREFFRYMEDDVKYYKDLFDTCS